MIIEKDIYHFGLDLFHHAGGSFTTVKMFQKAVGGRIISFSSKDNLGKYSKDEMVIHFSASGSVMGRYYNKLTNKEKERCITLCKNAKLITCHILFRHHVDVVRELHRNYGIPYICFPHGCLDPWVFTYRRMIKVTWMRLVGIPFLRNALCTVFATKNEQIKASCWLEGAKSKIITWPVIPIGIENKQRNREEIRKLLNIQDSDIVILYVGRLHHVKNPLQTLEAVAMGGKGKWHLIIVGPEEDVHYRDLKNCAINLGYKRLHIVGPVYGEDKIKYYHAADSFILLSEKENFGNVVAEAMSAELPVIISDGVDLKDIVLETKSGWIVAKNKENKYDLSGIAKEIELCIYEKKNMYSAREWVLKEASFEKFKENFWAIYNSMKSNQFMV